MILPQKIYKGINFAYLMSSRLRLFFGGFALLAGASVGNCQANPASRNLPSRSSSDAAGANARYSTTAAPQVESSEANKILQNAQAHLDNGRQFYFKGDTAGAKREFDSAVNVLLAAPDSLPDHQRIERRLDEMCDLIYRFDIEKLGAGQREEEAAVTYDKAPIDEVSHMTFPVDASLAPKLKAELDQTASAIPLELSEPVLSYVHFFSSERGRSILLSGFKRSGRYRPLIQRIFAEEGVPQELVYLAQAESGFLPRAVSSKAAVGMWQFISGTGSTYDLVRTSALDERLDPEKATRAAAKFLKDLHTRYGDWYLAMAAYNCGPGAVDRAIERTGYADFWELLKRHALPRETANYVPIIVAMTIMAKNPQDYGLQNIEVDQPVEYDSLQLTASTSLDLVADATLQPVSVIRDLNPSLLRTVVPAGFQVHVPKGTQASAQAALESVPAENRKAWRIHHVEAGDTLEAIARSYHLAKGRIAAVNPSTDSMEAGDFLLIPAEYHEEKLVVKRSLRARKSRSSRTTHAAALHRTGVASSRHISSSSVRHTTALHPSA